MDIVKEDFNRDSFLLSLGYQKIEGTKDFYKPKKEYTYSDVSIRIVGVTKQEVMIELINSYVQYGKILKMNQIQDALNKL